MRVTDRMQIAILLDNIRKSRDRMTSLQRQISTGKRINTLSDDPLSVHKAIRLRSMKASNERFQRNISDAKTFLSGVEDALGQAIDTLADVRTLTIRGMDQGGDYGRTALAIEVDELLEQLVDIANVNFAGRHLFAGQYTTEAPYEVRGRDQKILERTVFLSPDEPTLLQNTGLAPGSVEVWGVIYEEGVDYEVDYDNGTIRVLPGGGMAAGGTFSVIYRTETSGIVEREVTVRPGEVAPLGDTGLTPGSFEVKIVHMEGVDYEVDYDNGTIRVLPGGAIPAGGMFSASYRTETVGGVSERHPEFIDAPIVRQLTDGVEMQVNVSGREVFGGGETGRVNIFDLIRVLRNRLQRSDIEGLGRSLEELDEASNQVAELASEIGTKVIRADLFEQRLETENVDLSRRLSLVEDTDLAAAVMDFQAEQVAFQAALGMGARIIQPSLVNFLR